MRADIQLHGPSYSGRRTSRAAVFDDAASSGDSDIDRCMTAWGSCMTFSGQPVLQGCIQVLIASHLCTAAMLAWLDQHTYLADIKCFTEYVLSDCNMRISLDVVKYWIVLLSMYSVSNCACSEAQEQNALSSDAAASEASDDDESDANSSSSNSAADSSGEEDIDKSHADFDASLPLPSGVVIVYFRSWCIIQL